MPEGEKMPKLIEWIRPSGNPITTNDLPATIEEAKRQGWKKKGAK